MKNPGLSAFSAPTMTQERPSSHPIWGDVNDDVDPDRQIDEDEDDSDFMPNASFGRWRTPGASIRVPVRRGPTFKPGETPEDVIHGEVISPAEQDGADRIVNGEHESDQPSANPYVAKAQQDLRTPGSSVSVDTLSRLLKGVHPGSMSQEHMDAAHEWLSRHFTGVHVNTEHGTLLAASPAGTQMVKRKMNLPAIPEQQPAAPVVEPPSYTLTNKHGVFESHDPQRIVRSMIAFQILHNQIAAEDQKKKDDEDQANGGLNSTSGFMNEFAHGLAAPWKKPLRQGPLANVPESAVWEPGRGTDMNQAGKLGGYVMPTSGAPADWHHHQGTSYSPGHHMRLMLDPEEAVKPRQDPRFPSHTFTYAKSEETGHTEPRRLGRVDYWVRPDTHPAARNEGFDHIPEEEPEPEAEPLGRIPVKGPTAEPHDPPLKIGPPAEWQDDDDFDPSPPPVIPHHLGATVNDLCPVCASGYLEPYDRDYHECLNCGSLVKHIGFEREAARRQPGGLGRRLQDIPPYEGDPLNLGTGGSENPENVVDLDETMAHHPLAGEELDPEAEPTYQAPKRILDKRASDEIDDFMGKNNFSAIHKPGHLRTYVMPDPDLEGAFFRLNQGAPHPETGKQGWTLSHDDTRPPETWSLHGDPYVNDRGVPNTTLPQVIPSTKPGDKRKRRPMVLPDAGDRALGEKGSIAHGTHPIDDDSLNRAIKDIGQHGRSSQTYLDRINNRGYEPPALPEQGPKATQRDLRMLSSLEEMAFPVIRSNPGLVKFIG